jgi:thiamine pyrophosphokinase
MTGPLGPKFGVVIGNGRFAASESERELLERAALVVAADGGALHALEAGRVPEIVVGDFDSLGEAQLRRKAEAAGVREMRVVRVRPEKDETDLELALDEAIRAGCSEIVLLGALGGRLDHALANLQLLAAAAEHGVRAWARDGECRVWLLSAGDTRRAGGEESLGELALSGRPGEYLTLLPVTAVAGPVWTDGLKYPLKGENLYFGRARGVSNELLGESARVRLEQGALLVVAPGSAPGQANREDGA